MNSSKLIELVARIIEPEPRSEQAKEAAGSKAKEIIELIEAERRREQRRWVPQI
jgi:hypothetical protein